MPCCDNGDYKDEDFTRCAQCGRPLSSSDEVCEHDVSPSQADSSPPKSHLLIAVLSTLFGCTPFGVVAIVYAVKAASALKCGDLKAAREHSDWAAFWAWTAIVPILLVVALSLISLIRP